MAEGTIGLEEPSTITKSLRTVTQNINSSVVHQEVMTLGGANSSLEVATVRAAAPASTDYGLVVRVAGGPSSAVDLQARVSQGPGISTVADYWGVRAYQSTAADLQATVTPASGSTFRTQPGSTAWASSAGFHFDSSGALQVTGSTEVTVARMVGNSSAGDYMPIRVVNSSGDGFASFGIDYTDGSTTSTLAAPGLSYANGTNTTMRLVGTTQPLPVQIRTGTLTFASTTVLVRIDTAGGSTALVSSVASQAHKVFAYSVMSTIIATSSGTFISSAASDVWGLLLGTGSSGVSGANLAVTPPAYLFKTAAGEALGFSATSTGLYRVSISYFTE